MAAAPSLDAYGIRQYGFHTPGKRAAALQVLHAIIRPSPEQAAAISGDKYQEDKVERVDMDGEEWMMDIREELSMRAGKIAGLPYTFLWREEEVHNECSQGNVLLAVGTVPAACSAGQPQRPQFEEVYSFTTGELAGQARVNLPVFLRLSTALRQRFPAVTTFSDMQLLLMMIHATLPWPANLQDDAIYGDGTSYTRVGHLCTISTDLARVESMRGHPDNPDPAAAAAAAASAERQRQQQGGDEEDAVLAHVRRMQCAESVVQMMAGVLERQRQARLMRGTPGDVASVDTSVTGDRGFRYVCGLPIRSLDSPRLRAFLDAKFAAVAQFHAAQNP